PAYQLPFQSTGKRTTPDFAYNADSASPYWAYDSYGYGGLIGVYGTSAGAPQWAALVALADQALAQNGVGSLDGFSPTLPLLYKLAGQSYATYYNDIVSGSNGYQAGPGYDYVTGIGSPVADQIVLGILNTLVPPSGGARVPGGHPGKTPGSPLGSAPSHSPVSGHPGSNNKGAPTMLGTSSDPRLGLLFAGLANQ